MRIQLSALIAADVVALDALRPRADLLAKLAAPHAWVSHDGADAVAAQLAGAVLWLAAVWLGLGLLASLVTAAPGPAGRAAAKVARALLPRAVFRLAAGAAGLGVVLAPVAAGAAAPHPASPATGTAPAWPTDDPLPAPAWPVSRAPHSPAPAGSGEPPARHRPIRAAARPSEVVVRPGDSLWTIAAEHLPSRAGRPPAPSRIAAAWPQWYLRNRAVVGPDPDRLVPGQHLTAPEETS